MNVEVTDAHDWAAEAKVHVTADCWTESLARRRVRLSYPFDPGKLVDLDNHESVASMLGARFLEVQCKRHEIATAHGLSAVPGAALEASDIMIDGSPERCCPRRGVDPAVFVRKDRERAIQFATEVMPDEMRMQWTRGCRFRITDGDAAPILDCEVGVGVGPGGAATAELFGNILHVMTRIPDTLAAAAGGRLLGDVVATQIPALDRRRIVACDAYVGGTEFTLEPDRSPSASSCAASLARSVA